MMNIENGGKGRTEKKGANQSSQKEGEATKESAMTIATHCHKERKKRIGDGDMHEQL